MGVEVDELVRIEKTGGCLDLVVLYRWMRRTGMPGGDQCHTHTHPSFMLSAHSRTPAHNMHIHSFGGQGQSLTLLDFLCKGGLSKSTHGDPGQKMRSVHEVERESEAHTSMKPSL